MQDNQTTGKYPTHAGWWWFLAGNEWCPQKITRYGELITPRGKFVWCPQKITRYGELITTGGRFVSNTEAWRWGPEIKSPRGQPVPDEFGRCVCGAIPLFVDVKKTVMSGIRKGESLACKWRVECPCCGCRTNDCDTATEAITLWESGPDQRIG